MSDASLVFLSLLVVVGCIAYVIVCILDGMGR